MQISLRWARPDVNKPYTIQKEIWTIESYWRARRDKLSALHLIMAFSLL